MSAASDLTLLVDDLAGLWTEAALEMLKAAGVHPISVDMELETWRTMKKILRFELRWQRASRLATLVSMSAVMEEVLRETVLLVSRKFWPLPVARALEGRLRRWAGARRSTPGERRLYAEIVSQPELRAAFKPPTRTDFVPRLQVLARGG
jgi:hypothetical protein